MKLVKNTRRDTNAQNASDEPVEVGRLSVRTGLRAGRFNIGMPPGDQKKSG